MKPDEIGAAILIGGHARRMGTPKMLLDRGGEVMLSYLCRQLDGFGEHYISGSETGFPVNCLPNWKIIKDLRKDCGPLAGLEAVLSAADSDAVLFIACDMPFFTRELAQNMARSFSDEYDCLICRDDAGNIHPLCAVYRKTCLNAVSKMLDRKEYRLKLLTERVVASYLEVDHFSVINTNTPQEWTEAAQILAARAVVEMPGK